MGSLILHILTLGHAIGPAGQNDSPIFHWSEASFHRYWSTALAAIVARGQGDANCRHAHNLG